MADPLRMGVIGLGRHWKKSFRAALRALPDHFEVHALCDQVRNRARQEARLLGCHAVPGPTALLESAEVDALLLLDTQWFGLWPLELACRFGKPVFCAGPLEPEDARADALCQQVQNSRLPVMVGMTPRFAP